MNISKKVPIIVTIVLVLLWGFLGYRSAMNIDARVASPDYIQEVILAEDVRVIDVEKAIDAVLYDGETYDHSDIPAGSIGTARITYSRWHSIINDPETEVHAFGVDFYSNGNSIHACIKTGPNSQLDVDEIYYKKIENYEEIIFEYNQKVIEAKKEWRKQLILRMLTGLLFAAVFSAIFFIECIVANKIKMHPTAFGLFCFLYVLVLLFFMLFALVF